MINDNAYIVMNNSVNIVIDNNNVNAVTTLGSGGNIISENELNIIKWNIGTATGSYNIPFTTSSGVKIPLTLDITTSASGTGNIQFSTYGGATWDNDTYKPSGVTNMTNISATNNSAEVIDRFWMIDAQGYTTRPSGNIQFYYDDAEHTATGNTITESDLKAERYDPSANNWETYPVGGVVSTTSNYVTAVSFSSTDLVRSWTLIDQSTHLLPLVLVSYEAECFAGNGIISWQTASEANTDYFILEASADGNEFEFLAAIEAAGNSFSETSYSYIAENNSATYYKLILVNTNGETEELGITNLNCGTQTSETVNAYASGFQQITLQTLGLSVGNYSLQLFDIAGKLFLQKEIPIDNYFNQFIIEDKKLAAGMYILRLSGTHNNNPFFFFKKIQVLN